MIFILDKRIYMAKIVPITRIGKFFGADDYNLDIDLGMEYMGGDLNMTIVLYRIDRKKTKKDDVYGESPTDGIVFMPPIEITGLVQIVESTMKQLGNSKIEQKEPGNLKLSLYQKQLDDLNVEILKGDYLAYYVTEDKVRYYSVNDDGIVNMDNKHTYAGYKPFYRTIIATFVNKDEFRGK
jgi:hypothetical protein